MAYINVTVHECNTVRANFDHRNEAKWVDLTFTHKGKECKVCVFFEDADYARRLAKAINNVALREVVPCSES